MTLRFLQAGLPAPRGWYQVAFTHAVPTGLSPAHLGGRCLMLVRDGERVRAFDAACPHRGANLALSGRLDGEAVVCGFHGYSVHLGANDGYRLGTREHACTNVGGMVFVRLSADADHGWLAHLEALVRECDIVSGFEMRVQAPAATVIENAFDRRHFAAVHGVASTPFDVGATPAGGLRVTSTFEIPVAGGARRSVLVPYQALVFGPGLASVRLGGALPYVVVTGATPAPKGGCVIRLSLALPRQPGRDGADPAIVEPLLAHSRRGLEEDRAIWENLCPGAEPGWLPDDQASLAFLDFCRAHDDG